MFTIKLAWRNIWRNKTRSLVVIIALALGIFSAIFIGALAEGMVSKWRDNSIEIKLSDIQIHQKAYLIDEAIDQTIDSAALQASFDQQTGSITSQTFRLTSEAMANTATSAQQLTLHGIHPDQERQVTTIHEHLIEGNYFAEYTGVNPILISKKLAEELHVRMKSKIIVSFANAQGEITAANFKVVGIYKTSDLPFDQGNAFVVNSDLRPLLNLPSNQFHVAALRIASEAKHSPLQSALNAAHPTYQAQYWGELAPEIVIYADWMINFNLILVSIVLIALIFGIINTMLMVVLERTKEIGMLAALGVSRKTIALMITLETILMSLTGGIIGNIASIIVIAPLNKTGIHFGKYGEGFENFGFEAVAYPQAGVTEYLTVTALVIVTAIIAAIFPVRRALKLNPATAIRD